MKKLYEIAQLNKRLAGNTKEQKETIKAVYRLLANSRAYKKGNKIAVVFFGNVWQFTTNEKGKILYCELLATKKEFFEKMFKQQFI